MKYLVSTMYCTYLRSGCVNCPLHYSVTMTASSSDGNSTWRLHASKSFHIAWLQASQQAVIGLNPPNSPSWKGCRPYRAASVRVVCAVRRQARYRPCHKCSHSHILASVPHILSQNTLYPMFPSMALRKVLLSLSHQLRFPPPRVLVPLLVEENARNMCVCSESK